MDMNDILNQWLDKHGTVDKDKMKADTEERIRQTNPNYLREMKPEARIDLHGLHQDEAEQRLDNFVGDCKRRGIKKNYDCTWKRNPLARKRSCAWRTCAKIYRA